MNDYERVLGAKFLDYFQQSDRKVFELDLRVRFDLILGEVRDAIASLHAEGLITHNDNVSGWNKKNVTPKGRRFMEACRVA